MTSVTIAIIIIGVLLTIVVTVGIVIFDPDSPPSTKFGITRIPVLFSHKNVLEDVNPGKPGVEILVTSVEFSSDTGKKINLMRKKLGGDQAWVTAEDDLVIPYSHKVAGVTGNFIFGNKVDLTKQNLEELKGRLGLFTAAEGVNHFWLGEEILEIIPVSVDFDVLTLLVSQYTPDDSDFEDTMGLIQKIWAFLAEQRIHCPEVKEFILTRFPSFSHPLWIHTPENFKYIIPLS